MTREFGGVPAEVFQERAQFVECAGGEPVNAAVVNAKPRADLPVGHALAIFECDNFRFKPRQSAFDNFPYFPLLFSPSFDELLVADSTPNYVIQRILGVADRTSG